VIDDIPGETMRNQARIHSFRRKEDLLRAFEKVTLRVTRSHTRDSDNTTARTEIKRRMEPQTSLRQTAGQNVMEIRCYNCGRMGHTSRNCLRPRREPGVCYECGATGHQLRDCPRRERAAAAPRTSERTEAAVQISLVEQEQGDNEFLEAIELRISRDNLEYSQKFVSQLDTASPISLIKSKFILSNLTVKDTGSGYVGLNGSALQILGQVEAKIIRGSSSADEVILRVVPDHTMRCDVLLGRDAIRSLNIITIKPDVNRKDATSEILNIDLSISGGDEADKLKINPAVSNNTRDKFVWQFRETYLQAEKPLESKVKTEMKLHVKDKQHFHFAQGRIRNLSEIRKGAARKTEEARVNNERCANKKGKAAREYAKGDFIVVENFEAASGKLVPSYRGPYCAVKRKKKKKTDRYVIADLGGCQISQGHTKARGETRGEASSPSSGFRIQTASKREKKRGKCIVDVRLFQFEVCI